MEVPFHLDSKGRSNIFTESRLEPMTSRTLKCILAFPLSRRFLIYLITADYSSAIICQVLIELISYLTIVFLANNRFFPLKKNENCEIYEKTSKTIHTENVTTISQHTLFAPRYYIAISPLPWTHPSFAKYVVLSKSHLIFGPHCAMTWC